MIALDYETGKTVVGHRVKLIGQNGMGINIAILVEAHPNYAVVKPCRHKRTERVEWKYLRYDKSANAQARQIGRANR